MSKLLAHALIVLLLFFSAAGFNVHSLNTKSPDHDVEVDESKTDKRQESGANTEDTAGRWAVTGNGSSFSTDPSVMGESAQVGNATESAQVGNTGESAQVGNAIESAQVGNTTEPASSAASGVLNSQFHVVNRTSESVVEKNIEENRQTLSRENSEMPSDSTGHVNISLGVPRRDSVDTGPTNGSLSNATQPTDPSDDGSQMNHHPGVDSNHVDEETFTLGMEEEGNVSSSSNSSAENSNATEPVVSPVTKEAQCPTCQIRTSDRQHRIASLKHQILRSLHISKPPNASGIAIPKVPALTHLYDSDTMMEDSPTSNNDDEYDDQFIVKTERVFTGAREAPDGLNLNITDYVYFSPSVQLYTSHIKVTKLWLYIRKSESTRRYITLTVERVLPETISAASLKTKIVLSKKIEREKAFGWRRIEFRDILREWVKHPTTNVGLKIRAEDETGNNLVVLPPTPDVDKGYEPWLDSKIQEPRSNSRHRRSDSLVCSDNTTEARCCRYPLYVGFAEFGWEWIIAPTHVKADFCSGECRMSMQDQTPYGWIHNQVPGSAGSCCTPTKMSPLPLLYFDESLNIVYQILQNMKVDKCGCA